MHKCNICANHLSTSPNDCLIIENVPDSTFNFSEKVVDLHIAECRFCGAVQLIDVPLSSDFDVVYRSIGVSVSYREEKKRQIENFVKSHGLYDANMVEIGCGNGQYLEMINEIGIKKITGIESGVDNCNECVNKGFNVIHGNLLNVSNQEELRDLFEVFLSFYYLEHIPNPVDFVTCLYKIIKPGGIGVIEVPNYDHAEKSGNWLEFTKDHRFYYRKRTLCYLLSRCGFNVEVMEENNGGHSLTAIVRKPKISDVTFSLMKNQMKKDIDEFKKLIDKLNGTFTIYGAGHYSQLLLNIIHKQYGIKPLHIFDSNRQKCGQKICGVVIEHGDRVIDMQNCDNIIIICGIYNDEVYNALVKKSVFKEIIKWG